MLQFREVGLRLPLRRNLPG